MSDTRLFPDPQVIFAAVKIPGAERPNPYASLEGIQGVRLHRFDPDKKPKPRLIGEVIPQVGLGDLNGESRIGKTHLFIAMAVSLATGKPFLGCWKIMEHDGQDRSERGEIGVTLVVLGEGRDDFDDRLQAAYASLDEQSKVRLRKAGFDGLPVVVVDASDLSKKGRFDGFRKQVLEIKKQIESPERGVRIEMIVFDTVSSVFNFSDENSVSSVQPSLNALMALAEQISAFCLLISHPAKNGKKGEPRGTNAFVNSPDVLLAAIKRGKVKLGGQIRVEKVRDGETPSKTLPYLLSPVELPNGQTGVIAAPGNYEPEPTGPNESRTPNDVSILFDLIEVAQICSPVSVQVDGLGLVDAVRKEVVREIFCEQEVWASLKDKTKTTYFDRALRKLKKIGRVEEVVTQEDGRNVRCLRIGGQNELGDGASGAREFSDEYE